MALPTGSTTRAANARTGSGAHAPLGGGAPGNPFATSQLETSDFSLPASLDEPTTVLVSRVGRLGGAAQVLGKPGSGKTALLRALGQAAEAQGRRAALLRGDRELDAVHDWLVTGEVPAPPEPLLLLDEADRVHRRCLAALAKTCRDQGCWLVAASHRSLGLPTLQHCCGDAELATRIVARLLARMAPELRLVGPEEAWAAWHAARGNLHVALATLYRRHEQRWQQRTTTSSSSSRRS